MKIEEHGSWQESCSFQKWTQPNFERETMTTENQPKKAADYGLPMYFDMQAKMGRTKHLGVRKATDVLAKLYHVSSGQTVLNIGSGSGISATYLVQTYVCKVVGVNILPRMVESVQNWAKKELSSQL